MVFVLDIYSFPINFQIDVSRIHCPFRLYQIGSKFRGEMRPKFGLIRANEFIMKDLYTFDKDLDSAMDTYHQVILVV